MHETVFISQCIREIRANRPEVDSAAQCTVIACSFVVIPEVVSSADNSIFQEIIFRSDATITFDMEAANENYGTELFRSPNAVFYLADPVKGMFGFSRDGYMNTFAFRPYPGEKISVKITGDALSTSLFINGQLIERMGIEKRYLNEAEKQNNFIRTLVFPLKNAGNFESRITNLRVYNRLL